MLLSPSKKDYSFMYLFFNSETLIMYHTGPGTTPSLGDTGMNVEFWSPRQLGFWGRLVEPRWSRGAPTTGY